MTTVETIEHLPKKRFLPLARLRAVPNSGIYIGLAVIVAGCALLAVAWGRVAGLTNVGLQMPYVISAGCVGLGLVVAGLSIVHIVVKVADSRARAAQLDELGETLRAIREAVEARA